MQYSSSLRRFAFHGLTALLLLTTARAQQTTRVSVDSSGSQANGPSGQEYMPPSISSDGRLVAFSSEATNLVPGDTNQRRDVFVHDTITGTTERVSVDSSGVEGNSVSLGAALSGDGRYVAFQSYAWNLVPGDTNGHTDLFIRDLVSGTTERVSVDASGAQSDGDSADPSMSSDGSVFAFASAATNLVAGDTNGRWDIFVVDRNAGTIERVSVDSTGLEGNDNSRAPSISGDGRIVAFESYATNLVQGDTNGWEDVFVHDRSTGSTVRVNVSSSGTQTDVYNSYSAGVSADGRFVAFGSGATNLVAGDTNSTQDIFVHELATGVTERVSLGQSGAQGDLSCNTCSISSDGRFVAFSSAADNLVGGDTNADYDVFVRDRQLATTVRVSVDSAGDQADSNTLPSAISADGQIVAFATPATNLVTGDSNGTWDVFTHERCTATASWTNYGAGFPGTLGVPGFTAQGNPVLGTSLSLDLADSSGLFTVGLIFVGLQRTQIHSSWGGDLLVVPSTTLPVAIPPTSLTLTGVVPDDEAICNLAIDLQCIEVDPGAAKGVSFTAGLELVPGQ